MTTHYQRYQKGNPKYQESARWRHIKATYSISKDEWQQLYESQDGKCAICGCTDVPEERRSNLSVDHAHGPHDTARGTTDKTTIRGLLCQPCNKGLGSFKDDPELLIKAVEYLNKPKPLSQSSVG